MYIPMYVGTQLCNVSLSFRSDGFVNFRFFNLAKFKRSISSIPCLQNFSSFLCGIKICLGFELSNLVAKRALHREWLLAYLGGIFDSC